MWNIPSIVFEDHLLHTVPMSAILTIPFQLSLSLFLPTHILTCSCSSCIVFDLVSNTAVLHTGLTFLPPHLLPPINTPNQFYTPSSYSLILLVCSLSSKPVVIPNMGWMLSIKDASKSGSEGQHGVVHHGQWIEARLRWMTGDNRNYLIK